MVYDVVIGTHEEMVQDPEGAYSQLVRLQEGSNEGTGIKESERIETILEIESSSGQTGSRRFSSMVYMKTLGMLFKEEFHESSFYGNKADERRKKVSLRRLAHLNKTEIPFLFLGSVAAIVYGSMYPIFGYLLSSSITMFFYAFDQLLKEAHYWMFVYISLGVVNFVAVPVQNYFFGIAGGKLIKRIRLMMFGKILHQEISWFDNSANSRYYMIFCN